MVFVVDDLAAWLVGLLADAGRKKLTTLVLGGAQERALQQAADADHCWHLLLARTTDR